jgi:hypothetical protein
MTKAPLFPKDWVKLSLKRRVDLEDLLLKSKSHTINIQNILDIDDHRTELIAMWDDMTPEQRANIGKSEDEIKNGYNAKSRSPITFEGVKDMDFAELSEFWQGAWLSGIAHTMSKNTPNCCGTQKTTGGRRK